MDRFYWNAVQLKNELDQIEIYKTSMEKNKYDGWYKDLEIEVEYMKRISIQSYYERLKEIKSTGVAHG